MIKYIIKRLLLLIPVLLGVTLILFFIIDQSGGDPARNKLGEQATEEAVQALRDEWGLNDPFFVRYANYLIDLCHGDLGESYQTDEDVFQKYIAKFPPTFALAICSMLLCAIVAIPLGILASTHQNSWLDTTSMILALVGVSMPTFWLALLLMMLFCIKLGWLPAVGFNSAKSLILPVVTEALFLTGLMTRTTRSAMLDTLRADYMTTALAKGVSKKKAIFKHALRNAMIPIVTLWFMQFLSVISGTFAIEKVFSWPGIGSTLLAGINYRDTPIIEGFLIMTSIIVCVIQLLMDLSYALIDPRIKSQYRAGRG